MSISNKRFVHCMLQPVFIKTRKCFPITSFGRVIAYLLIGIGHSLRQHFLEKLLFIQRKPSELRTNTFTYSTILLDYRPSNLEVPTTFMKTLLNEIPTSLSLVAVSQFVSFDLEKISSLSRQWAMIRT